MPYTTSSTDPHKRTEQTPFRRRDGLRLVADLYRELANSSADPVPEGRSPPAIVIAADVDLSDLADEGIKHFHPDVFTSLIEAGDDVLDLNGREALSLPFSQLPDGFSKGDSRASDSAAYSDAALGLSGDNADASTTSLIATRFAPVRVSRSFSEENDSVTQ
jgi:hypothetical protein